MIVAMFVISFSLLVVSPKAVRHVRCAGVFFSALAAGFLLILWHLMPAYCDDARANPVNPRPVTDLEPYYRASVLRGWRAFQTSFARDGVACVHCHPQHKSLRSWAKAYPKVEIFDGTPYRVKGLRSVVLETLEKHTDLLSDEQLAIAEDLVAYIAWWGDGQLMTPGYSRIFPPAAEDLIKLRFSVERGSRLFHQETFGPCTRCHDVGKQRSAPNKIPLDTAATTFPRYINPPGRVMSLEAFLSWHLMSQGKGGYDPCGSTITDLSAYLAGLAKGKQLHPGGR